MLGVLPEKWGPTVKLQAKKYLEEKFTDSERPVGDRRLAKVGTYKYWQSKKGAWPELAAAALYWTAFTISSISAERAFARLRVMGSPLRNRMLPKTIVRELRFRVNMGILEKLLEKHFLLVPAA